MLKKENRITLKNDFDQVFKQGSSFYTKILGIKVLDNKKDNIRLGVIVSNKVSKKAVKRNQLKRIIRDFFYKNLDKLTSGKDIVVITLPEIVNKEKKEINESLVEILNRKKLLKE
jgi:ribonuclease P protein component